MAARAALAITLAALALSGCPGRPCPVAGRRFTDPVAAVRAYRSMRSYARVLHASASVDRRSGEGRVRGDITMVLERPDRVRFDAMTQFGPVATLTSDGDTFALMDLREERFFVGPTCPENVARLLGIPLAAEEVAALLVGEGPLLDPIEDEQITCDDGRYRIDRRAADGTRQTIELEVREADVAEPPELQRMRLRRAEVRGPDGATRWLAEWDDYRFVEDPTSDATPRMGVVMPFRVRFQQPAAGVDTLVRFERIEMNARVEPETFVQRPRPGLAIEAVSCSGE